MQRKIFVSVIISLFGILTIASASFAQGLDGIKTIPFHLNKKNVIAYSNPGSKVEYPLKNSAQLVSILRNLGLSLKATTLKKYLTSHFPKFYSGKMVAVLAGKGMDIYYINPTNLKGSRIGTSDQAYQSISQFLMPPKPVTIQPVQTVAPTPTPIINPSPSPITVVPQPIVTAPQTIPGVTGIVSETYLDDQGIVVPFLYLSGTDPIADQSAYQVPVTVEVAATFEGYDEQNNQPSLGGKIFDITVSSTKVLPNSDHGLTVHIPYEDIKSVLSGGIQMASVKVTIVTPSQGSFSTVLKDQMLAGVQHPVNDIQLNGDMTGTYSTSRHFYLKPGALSLYEYNTGDYDNIFMWLVDGSGSKDLIVNEIGGGNRQDTTKIYTAGWYALQVQSPGRWSLEMKQ